MCDALSDGREPLLRIIYFHDMNKPLPHPSDIAGKLLSEANQVMEEYEERYNLENSSS
jgi:hypothetical protein